MKNILVFLICISLIFAVFNVDFSSKEYFVNLEDILSDFPSFPDWTEINWSEFKLNDWSPLGEFFKFIYHMILWPVDFLFYLIKLLIALFGFDLKDLVDFGGDIVQTAGGGGNHGGR